MFFAYLLFFAAAVLKGLNYRWSVDEQDYVRTLQIKEVLFEEEINLNRKLSKRDHPINHPGSSIENPESRLGKENSAIAEDGLNSKNIRVRIDYEETSPYKEVIFRLIDQSNPVESKFFVSRGAENIGDHDLDDDRHVQPVETDHRPLNTES